MSHTLKKGLRYYAPKGGEWQHPKVRGYKMMCCDCGLVHVLNFRLLVKRNGTWTPVRMRWPGSQHRIEFQAFRDNRATAAARRKFETIRVIKGPKAKTRTR